MTEQDINWIYIRNRLRMVTPECFITDEVIKEVYRMLSESYQTGIEKGQEISGGVKLERKPLQNYGNVI